MSALQAFPADGYEARWQTWDGVHDEHLRLRWENEAWTAMGEVGRQRVHYVLRIAPTWEVRQFLLFRDLDEPDLWLYTDGTGRWGEMNGAHRTELDGCTDIELGCTPFTGTVPIRRSQLAAGEAIEVAVIDIDVDTLAVQPRRLRYERTGLRRWLITEPDGDRRDEVEIDDYGLVTDSPGRFRRR
jgi:hypothetical protein